MKVLTGNVFITKSLDAIEQVHFSKNKLTTFMQKIKTLNESDLEQSFIASPMQNDGLVRFEYQFKANKEKGGVKVKLEILETSKLLEMFLLENDPMARMIAAKLEYRSQFIGKKTASLLESGANQASFEEALKLSNKYYMSFGSSDNVDEWSGPFTMTLASARLRNDRFNNRIIEVVFVPDTQSFKSWSSKFSHAMGYKDDLSNLSQFMTADTYQITKAKSKISLKRRANSPSISPDEREVYDLDYRIRDLIRRYIGAFTGKPGQAVVVLPHRFGQLSIKNNNSGTPTYLKITKSDLARGSSKELNDDDTLGGQLGGGRVTWEASEALRKLGIDFGFVRPNQFSDQVNDYLKQNGFEDDPLRTDLLYGGSVFSSSSARSTTAKVIEFKRQQDIAYEQEVNKAYDNEISRISNEFQTAVAEADERREQALFTIESETPEQIQLRYNLFSIPLSLVKDTAREREEELYTYNISFPTAARDRRERQAVSKRDNALKPDSALRREHDRDVEQKIASQFGKAPQAAVTNPSLLGLEGSVDDVRNQIKNDTLKKYNILNKINVEGKWDLLTDSLQQLAEAPYEFVMYIEQRNEPPATEFDGFSPLVAPLVKISSALKSLDDEGANSLYDFYEENDMRVLRLWKKYGLIRDDTTPAYVFGDMNQVKCMLYGDEAVLDQDSVNTTFALNAYKQGDSELLKGGVRISDPRLEALRVASSRHKSYKKDFMKAFPSDTSVMSFKHNMADSNVVSLNFDLDNYYAALINMPVRPLLDINAIGTTRKQLAKTRAQEILGKKVAERLAKYKSSKTFIGLYNSILGDDKKQKAGLALDLFEQGLAESGQSQIDLFLMMFLYLNADSIPTQDEPDLTSFEVPPADMDKYYKAIADETARLLYRVDVRTFPIFNMKSFLFRKCNLVGEIGGMIGQDVRNSKGNRAPAPYNGEYSIVGVRHVISPKDIYSEFDLLRGTSNKDVPIKESAKSFICKTLKPLVDEYDRIEKANSSIIDVGGYAGQGGDPAAAARFIRQEYGVSIDRVKKALEDLGCGGSK